MKQTNSVGTRNTYSVYRRPSKSDIFKSHRRHLKDLPYIYTHFIHFERDVRAGLVESFQSTHCHMIIQTEDPAGFMYTMRQSYSKYFNRKYRRHGRVGEKHHFTMEIVGLHHHLAAMTYVLRNALHHGVVPIPYAYPHCSANSIFRKEMGKWYRETLLDERHFYRFVGRKAEWPSNYKMSEKGLFLRESVLDVVQVENMYTSPRAFNYYMSRKSGEEWDKEQDKDRLESGPIRLEDIENGIRDQTLEKMFLNENGRADYRKLSDIDLCTQFIKTFIISSSIPKTTST